MSDIVSECCGAGPWLGSTDHERCGDCKEWTEFIDLDEEDDTPNGPSREKVEEILRNINSPDNVITTFKESDYDK